MRKACNINTLSLPTNRPMRVVFLVLSIGIAGLAYGQRLSDSATISLLTASPGEELYSTFGHSALRVKDPAQNLDIVFNYGHFDDREPYFYYKFTRRKVDYFLSYSNFDRFLLPYKYENRSIVEQVLNLNQQQVNRLYSLLIENFKPENRYYRYDFFFDNCATRIRDIMPEAFPDGFIYNYPEEWKEGDITFRNLIDLYLQKHHWSDFGIDLALGLPTDKLATPDDFMFLPDYLMEGFSSAGIVVDGVREPFVRSMAEILSRRDLGAGAAFITPTKVCWIVFGLILVVTGYGFRKKQRLIALDMMYFSLLGMVGWIVFFLDFFTDHIATKTNLNILWAFPLHFPIFLFWNILPWNAKKYYLWIFLSMNVLILLLWPYFPQQYHIAFIPLILALIIRMSFILAKGDDKTLKSEKFNH
jgi:hypothetical protein